VGEDVQADQPVVGRSGVLTVEIDGAHVLYDPERRRAHVLNQSAATIWAMLDSSPSMDELTQRLVGQGLSPTEAARDVQELLDRFRSQGLVRASAGPDIVNRSQPTPLSELSPPDAFRSATLSVLDQRVVVASTDAGVVDAVDWFGAPLRVDEPGERLVVLEPAPGFERSLPARLNRIAAESTSSLVVHAAGVVVGSSLVLLPGPPGSGKSTLAAALVDRGCGYASDEAIGLRPNLEAVGYPKRIALELGSWSLFTGLADLGSATRDGFDPSRVRWVDARDLSRDAIGWTTARQRPRLRLGVAACYRPEAHLEVRRLEPIDALTTLLANDFNLPIVGMAGLTTMRRIAVEVPFYRVEHGGLDQVLPAVEELVATAGLGAVR